LYAFSFERCLQEAATDEKELMLESLPAPSADSIIEAQAPTTKDDEAEHSEPGALPVTGMPTRTGSKTASTAPEESGGDADKPTRRKQAAYERRWREQDELRTAVKLVLKDYSRGQLANLTANLVSGDRGPMDVATISTFACGLSVLQPSNERKLTLALAKIGIVLGHQSEP
jgi:hypothetical protein